MNTQGRVKLNLEQVTQYIREHVPDVSAKEVSTHFGYSQYHFSRAFSKEMGVTLREYISAQKIQKGIDALEAGAEVIDSQLESGFESAGTFSNTFKSHTASTPKKHQALLNEVAGELTPVVSTPVVMPKQYRYAPFLSSRCADSQPLHIHVSGRTAPNSLLFVGLLVCPA